MQNQKQIIKTARLINLISPQELQPYVNKYQADFSANKLHTIVFLKLFLYSWLTDKDDLSLGAIAQNSRSPIFRKLAQLESNFSIAKSSLSDRLSIIPYQLFQDLFENLAQKTLTSLPHQQLNTNSLNRLVAQSRILDSTIVTLSAKLLQAGYQINEGQLSLKASIAIQGRKIPVKALVLCEPTYSSENKALPRLFDFSQKEVIYLFDRGIHALQIYADILDNGSHFVSRLSSQKYETVKTNKLPKNPNTATLTVIKDELIVFPNLKTNNSHSFRLITAVSGKDRQTLRFITDLVDITALEITELYRHRWSIEIFFRFLKQELHLENLLSYSENGIKVHVYLTLIAFLLTWFYKEQNNIKSFKRARQQLKWSLLEILATKQFQQGFTIGIGLKNILDTS